MRLAVRWDKFEMRTRRQGMDDTLLPAAYKPFILVDDKREFQGGICFSNATLEQLQPSRHQYLHSNEASYYSTLKFLKRQLSYLLGRYCAKQAIAVCVGIDQLTEIEIQQGIFHQPIIDHITIRNMQVSISHTENLGAAIAFPEAIPMAIDMETVSSSRIGTINTVMTDSERSLSTQFSGDDATFHALLWTVKEALSKVLKCGLSVSFELLEIAAIQQHEGSVRSEFKNFHNFQAFSFHLENAICTIVYPKQAQLQLDVAEIQATFQKS